MLQKERGLLLANHGLPLRPSNPLRASEAQLSVGYAIPWQRLVGVIRLRQHRQRERRKMLVSRSMNGRAELAPTWLRSGGLGHVGDYSPTDKWWQLP